MRILSKHLYGLEYGESFIKEMTFELDLQDRIDF